MKISRHRTWVTAIALTVAAIGSSCAPTPTSGFDPATLPGDINLMDDAQLQEALSFAAPKLLSGLEDPKFLAEVPAIAQDYVRDLRDQLSSPAGREKLANRLREFADTDPSRVLPTRPTNLNVGSLGLTNALFTESSPPNPVPTGVRTPPPSGQGTFDVDTGVIGAYVALPPPSAAACGAPGGNGSIAVPASAWSGQLLSPRHDQFTRTTEGIAVGSAGPLVIAGAPDGAGDTPGIEFRSVGFAGQQMKVRIHLEDPKHFGPGAVYPIINIRGLGAAATTETRATIVNGGIYCYAGDTRPDRGYFEGWINIPRNEPGFQIIAEVVENDWYFRCNFFDPTATHCDVLLNQPGPQYWAGADRSTIHAGAAPLTDTTALPASVGAFASAARDGVGGPNVLTETNGQQSDDIESAMKILISSTVKSAMTDRLARPLVAVDPLDFKVIYATASLIKPLETTLDVRFTRPDDGGFAAAEAGGEISSSSGALRIDGSVHADLSLSGTIFGLPCNDIPLIVDVDVQANAWASSAGASTGLVPHVPFSVESDARSGLEWWERVLEAKNPTCLLIRAYSGIAANTDIEDGVSNAIVGQLGIKTATECEHDPRYFAQTAPGTFVQIVAELPPECQVHGALRTVLEDLSLNDYLPEVTLGSTVIKPQISNIDNAWCHMTGAPLRCSVDQDLIGTDGVETVADTTLLSTLGQAFGQPLGGRFPNVFSPSTVSSVADLTHWRRDSAQRIMGIGAVIDPRLINLALRHLTQGGSSQRSTNGLLNIGGVTLPVLNQTVSVRPEVAPMVASLPRSSDPITCTGLCGPNPYPTPPSSNTVAVMLPDLRVSLADPATGGAPIEFSLATSLNAGAVWDPSTRTLKPTLDAPQVDLQVISGCQVNYDSGYALSYTLCGRGKAGSGANNANGSPISFTHLLSFLANELAFPLLAKSIGNIKLPALDGIVNGFAASFTDVHFNQRGGFLAVYANLRPTPRIAIVPSTSGGGATEVIRFFPQLVDGIDRTKPTTYTWEITDAATGAALETYNWPDVQGGKLVNVSSFGPYDILHPMRRDIRAKLTVAQSDFSATAEAVFPWEQPGIGPLNPCIPNPGARLLAAPGC